MDKIKQAMEQLAQATAELVIGAESGSFDLLEFDCTLAEIGQTVSMLRQQVQAEIVQQQVQQ